MFPPFPQVNMPLEWVFQQNNDTKHTSDKSKTFFKENKFFLLSWPSQSPDLNPNENL